MRPRTSVLLLAILASAAAGLATASSVGPKSRAAADATFVLTGRGWGHGVGLSQCGAIGYAKHGWKAARILAHYYTGTKIVQAPVARVRVLLADGRATATISSRTAFKVKDGKGVTYPLRAGTYPLGASLRVKVDPAKKARQLPGPLTFVPGAAALALDKQYRGQLVVRVSGGRLRVVNSVPVEQYLYGVVPLEIGSTAPVEALKAQAIAARSFSLAQRASGDFDLYPDTRSQVYGGVPSERPETNAAVDATAGRVLTFGGKVIPAYYFASSGGRTAAVEDGWPGSRPIPYLVSVDDPYDDSCPSVHSWGPYVWSAAELARRLRVAGSIVDVRTVVNPSQRVTTLAVQTSRGRVTLAGTSVRRTLGLRSTWFRIGVLSLTPPAGVAPYGSAVALSGVARGLGRASLQRRPPGKGWSPAGRVVAAAGGSFTARVKATQTLEYRVTAGKAVSGAVRVPVAPRLRLEAVGDRLSGTVRPALRDASVEIQRQTARGWRTMVVTKVRSAGVFSVGRSFPIGSYRARMGPRAGFASAISSAVEVAE